MGTVISNTFFNFFMIPTYFTLIMGILIYMYVKQDKNKPHIEKGDLKKLMMVWAVVMSISFAYSYFFIDYDPFDTKLIHNLDSSTFYAIGYDKRFKKAKLIFNTDVANYGVQRVYIYDLPEHIWEEFRLSSSLGDYYNKNIKGKYKSYVIETDPSDEGWHNRE